MNIKGKKCLVAGGAGFIGSHLVDELVNLKCHVSVIDNLATGKLYNLKHHLDKNCINFIEGSITESSDIKRAFKGVDLIFDLACLGVRHSIKYPFENHKVNAEGTLRLLEEAKKNGIERFIYCSSSEVYGTALYVPMPESHPTYPCTVYGGSKLAGEAYTRAYYKTYGLPTVIVRPFNTYGPRSHHEGDAGEMIPKSIVRALNGKPILIFGDGKQTRDFTYVTDVAKGLIACAISDEITGHTVNIGSGFEISIKELAKKITKMIGAGTAEIKYTPDRPGDVGRLYADSSKFKNISKWHPEIKLDDGLSKTIHFFKTHPTGIENLMKDELGRNWEK